MSINFNIKYNSILPEINKNRNIYKTRNKIELSNQKIKTLKRVNSNFNNKNKYNFKNLTNQSITELNNKKYLVKSNSSLKNEFMFNSENKIDKNLNQNNEKDNTHKSRISDLLNNAKDFFNNLGNYLEENKPKVIPSLNANKIYKRLSKEKRKDILFPRTIKNKERNINKLYGRLYNIKILEDENKTTISNKTNSFIINKNISKISNIEDFETKNNNFTIEKKQKNQIIQTFNIQNTNERNKNTSTNNEENKYYESNITSQKENDIFPVLNSNNFYSNFEHNNKNNIKIAEIREVFPCFPFNRLNKITNSSRTDNKRIKNYKFFYDLRKNFVSDTRYYYEKFLRDIKLGSNESGDNILFRYRNRVKRKTNNNKIKKIYI